MLCSFKLQFGQFAFGFEVYIFENKLRNRIQIKQIDIVDQPAEFDMQCFYVSSFVQVVYDFIGLI